ncbi:hypothetical protein J0S82_017733 [Galemys pyrenaicus]|uniref:Uncharacterized protein n=1 Tax=Galemys pyrenaicus TaxID=202257 RepID=A0A8J6B2F6_GALPY|nr:hypothetical protein J0S82_017733 [Galemys pyrenaicus]
MFVAGAATHPSTRVQRNSVRRAAASPRRARGGSRDPAGVPCVASGVAPSLRSWPRGSSSGEPAGRYEDATKMTSNPKPFQRQLRRSISEQLRDSTARAWDLLWKNVREKRLAGR